MMEDELVVNGRSYRWISDPVVVVCVDGCQYEYIAKAAASGVAPCMKRMLSEGAAWFADCVVPTLTNPNNVSIVTGVPPSVHGISGNCFLDQDRGAEVFMDDPKYLRADTILAAFAEAGAKVAVLTAKDKLRRLLGHKLNGICLSPEQASVEGESNSRIERALELTGLALPYVPGADASKFVLALAVAIMRSERPDLMYVSTADHMQHTAAPGTPYANAFYAMMDRYLSALDNLGCTIGLTADHGMSAKHAADGQANIIYLQDVLDEWLGVGRARVVLPMSDSGLSRLGSFATAYLSEEAEAELVRGRLEDLEGMERVLDRNDACRNFELPPERIGHLVAISQQDWVIGSSRRRRELAGLQAPLRSHGGLSEQRVPLIFNRRLRGPGPGARLRNFDAFHIALNGLH